MRFSYMFTAAKTTFLAVGSVGLKTPQAICMSAYHYDRINHNFKANRALKEAGRKNL
jgi:hypothetical protein